MNRSAVRLAKVVGLLVATTVVGTVDSGYVLGDDRSGMKLAGLMPEIGGVPEVPPPEPAHHEHSEDPPASPSKVLREMRTYPAQIWVHDGYESIQVNVDALGNNIVGDAANEPSIAVDPNNANRMAIGWRQFDSITSNFRQSGVGYTQDGGQSWTFPGVLEPLVFSSDPVLDADADGRFYYYALQPDRGGVPWACYMYRSDDGGLTWPQEMFAWGGDKAWFTIDRTEGIGRGNVYIAWSINAACCGADVFIRSVDGGLTYTMPMEIPLSPRFGTLNVGPDGELYVIGYSGNFGSHYVAKSSNAKDRSATPVFEQVTEVDMGGSIAMSDGPNPVGLLGQLWIATDHSSGPSRGNVYALASIYSGGLDPLDIHFVRSTDGGLTWSTPVRVNDDSTSNDAWQWFGTMSVAPNGRIDAIWNDTRDDVSDFRSVLYYSYSLDTGVTWSTNVSLSPSFNHSLGWPAQNKLGDYYDMVSDNLGASVAYAATFNGEQDVYYLRIGEPDCNGNEVPDSQDVIGGFSDDCNENEIPDECDPDCNDNEIVDECEVVAQLADDCDDNLVPDECDPNYDGDELIDGCDPDIDNDGVLNDDDECDFTTLGMPVLPNGRAIYDTQEPECVIDLEDFGDVDRFFKCIQQGGPGANPPSRCVPWFDYERDNDVDLKDFGMLQAAFGK